jgi:hypothetical protein
MRDDILILYLKGILASFISITLANWVFQQLLILLLPYDLR